MAFVCHAGGEIVLRPIGRVARPDGAPRRLLPGDGYAGLTFAELASAFQGVVEIQSETSEGKIVEGSALGAPSLLSFVVDPRGVVGVRALEGHAWAEDIAPGRSVFGQAASVLQAAGRGTLELEPETLSARIIGHRSTSNTEDAAARDPDDGGGEPSDGQPERADRSFPRSAAWAGSAVLCLLAGVGVWTWLATGSRAPPDETVAASEAARDPATVPPSQPPAADEGGVVLAGPGEPVDDPAADEVGPTQGAVEQEREQRAAPEEERLEAVAAVLSSAVRLGRTYLRDVDDLARLMRAEALCENDRSCREMFAPAQARAEAALTAAGEAYVALVDEAAREFPPDLLKRGLGALENGPAPLDAEGDELARQFVAHVEAWGTDQKADPRAMLADLRRFPDGPNSRDPGLLVRGSKS